MSRSSRILLTILLCGSLLMATTVGVTVAAVYRAGSIAVEVHEGDGQQLHVAVPAGLVRLAIWFVPASVIEPAMVDEVRAVLPAVRAGWQEFLRTPDFVLAEVKDGYDHVRVEKRGRQLLVLVDSAGSSVRVAVPLATVGPLLAKLERAGARRA